MRDPSQAIFILVSVLSLAAFGLCASLWTLYLDCSIVFIDLMTFLKHTSILSFDLCPSIVRALLYWDSLHLCHREECGRSYEDHPGIALERVVCLILKMALPTSRIFGESAGVH